MQTQSNIKAGERTQDLIAGAAEAIECFGEDELERYAATKAEATAEERHASEASRHTPGPWHIGHYLWAIR